MNSARCFHAVALLSIQVLLLGCPAGNEATLSTILPADAEPGRWVLLDGANNTRDIGGYLTGDGRTVRRNTVYRSGTLSRLTSTGCQSFRQLEVRRVIDFRNRLAPSPLFDGDAPCVFEASQMSLLPVLVPPSNDSDERYVLTVSRYASSYRQAFELLAVEGNLPLLYHCAAGKDRTGVMTVLLLTLLGVERQEVIADYELSDLVAAPVSTARVLALFEEIDRQGGIESYLAGIGVPASTQEAIRRLLLE